MRRQKQDPARLSNLSYRARAIGGLAPGERTALLRRQQRAQRSVLDFVLDDARRLRDRRLLRFLPNGAKR